MQHLFLLPPDSIAPYSNVSLNVLNVNVLRLMFECSRDPSSTVSLTGYLPSFECLFECVCPSSNSRKQIKQTIQNNKKENKTADKETMK